VGWVRLDPMIAALDNNLHGMIYGPHQPDALAPLPVDSGWSARMAAWGEVEIPTSRWCLLISSGGQMKLSGVIAPDRLDDFAALGAPSLGYELEPYNGQEPVRELASGLFA
jgi:hypothetical protein